LIDNEIIDIGKQVYDHYSSIPSAEIWTQHTPVGLFKQIEYYWEAGIFHSKKDVLKICDEIKEEFIVIEKQAETGRKMDSKRNIVTDENSYMLYWSDIEFGNNCIFGEIEEEKIVYLVFNTFNSLSTRNHNFCLEIEKWLNNLIKKSNLISDVSEKQRYQFFKSVNNEIDKLMVKISND
jgi:hypothetical protein